MGEGGVGMRERRKTAELAARARPGELQSYARLRARDTRELRTAERRLERARQNYS